MIEERLAQRIRELEIALEGYLQEADAEEVAYREGELTGWRDALSEVETILGGCKNANRG